MSAQASSSQPSGFGTSGALSHVYIQYPPLRCKIPGARNIFYDDATKQLILPTSDQVFCWKTTPFNPKVAPSSDLIGEGPVLSIRYSLDLKLLAVQRSPLEVQIQNRESGDTFSHKCRCESERILGFFWTDSPTCDIVFVKTSRGSPGNNRSTYQGPPTLIHPPLLDFPTKPTSNSNNFFSLSHLLFGEALRAEEEDEDLLKEEDEDLLGMVKLKFLMTTTYAICSEGRNAYAFWEMVRNLAEKENKDKLEHFHKGEQNPAIHSLSSVIDWSSGTRSLQLAETKKLNVSWYVYTHESRLVLLATGMQCKSLTGYQISSVGIVRLPRFDMAMAKSEANTKPVLAAEDIYILTVYGRIYCLQLDKIAMQLHCYRFYRDAVIQQGCLPVYSNKIAVSVVDNVLLVHQVDAKVVILYDMFADFQAPVSAPLPLLVRGFYRANIAASQLMGQNVEGLEGKDSNHGELAIYADEWVFIVPDLICDIANGVLWKIHLDLEAISASCSEVQTILEFSQRRKLEANKDRSSVTLNGYKQLCLAIARTIILERRPVPMVAKAIDVLVNCFSLSIKTGKHHTGSKVERSSTTSGSNVNSAIGESISRADTSVKPPKQESSSSMHDKSIVKSSSFTSDSEDNVSFSKKRGKSKNVDLSSSEQNGGSTPLRTDEQQESLVTSAAISPDDLCSFLFAPVEEEMAGDASYLVAIIVEFLRRYTISLLAV
ncbi:hypothetical protein RND71_008090 [Anisodus tanguticus]|uniref:Regulator of MON1-CCZ1 complex N-terminal domain-containing protein n=1 Tax=Anisodus tanguticus TaxID=243964 RepID=A0AAE1SN59_9SOLA|nr:hypothetical protein RND71_008090 [Anisodus tanguticus]